MTTPFSVMIHLRSREQRNWRFECSISKELKLVGLSMTIVRIWSFANPQAHEWFIFRTPTEENWLKVSRAPRAREWNLASSLKYTEEKTKLSPHFRSERFTVSQKREKIETGSRIVRSCFQKKTIEQMSWVPKAWPTKIWGLCQVYLEKHLISPGFGLWVTSIFIAMQKLKVHQTHWLGNSSFFARFSNKATGKTSRTPKVRAKKIVDFSMYLVEKTRKFPRMWPYEWPPFTKLAKTESAPNALARE